MVLTRRHPKSKIGGKVVYGMGNANKHSISPDFKAVARGRRVSRQCLLATTGLADPVSTPLSARGVRARSLARKANRASHTRLLGSGGRAVTATAAATAAAVSSNRSARDDHGNDSSDGGGAGSDEDVSVSVTSVCQVIGPDVATGHYTLTLGVTNCVRAWLERDRLLVSGKHKLLALPARISVCAILERYFHYWSTVVAPVAAAGVTSATATAAAAASSCAATLTTTAAAAVTPSGVHGLRHQRQSSDPWWQAAVASRSLCLEIVDSLRIVFDFTCQLQLLYKLERGQYLRLVGRASEKRGGNWADRGGVERSLKKCRRTLSDRSASKWHVDMLSEPAVSTSVVSPLVTEGGGECCDTAGAALSNCSVGGAAAAAAGGGVSGAAGSVTAAAGGASGARRSQRLSSHSHEPTVSAAVSASVAVSAAISGGDAECVPPQLHELTASRADAVPSSSPAQPLVTPTGCDTSGEIVLNGRVIPSGCCLLPVEERCRRPAYPSTVYGATHLLRLLVTLPNVLAELSLSEQRAKLIMHHASLIVDFITRCRHTLLTVDSYT